MSQYFRLFPVIEYGKFLAKNITANVRFSQKTRENTLLYHQYGMKEGDNCRTIAGKYYEDENLDWLVYFANDIVDPYYDTYLSQNAFDEYIVNKYQSPERAMLLTAGWINDWRSDDGTVPTSVYNALPAKLKKYYDPVLDYNRNLTAYKRAQVEMRTNTNRIVRWRLSSVITGSSRTLIDIYATGVRVGMCELVGIDGTDISVQHVVLTSDDEPTHIEVEGTDMLVSISEKLVDYDAITADEITFWRSVSCFEAEQVSNDAKKNLNLISNQFSGEFKRQLKDKLS